MHPSLTRERPVQFIGEIKHFGSLTDAYLFMDSVENTFHVVPSNQVEIFAVAENEERRSVNPTLFIESGSQGQSPTCAAATLFNCIRQTGLQDGAPAAIRQQLSREAGGARLYELYIDRIYNSGDVDFGAVIQRSAAEFGLKTFEHPRTGVDAFAQSIYRDVGMGWPVLIRFDIMAGMQPAPFQFLEHRSNRSSPEVLHPTMWVPDTALNENVGHAITLMSLFWVGDQSYFLVADPNFRNPRVWPTNYLGRLFSARMRAWTTWYRAQPPSVADPFEGAVGMLQVQ